MQELMVSLAASLCDLRQSHAQDPRFIHLRRSPHLEANPFSKVGGKMLLAVCAMQADGQ